jgi:hypothetical protein
MPRKAQKSKKGSPRSTNEQLTTEIHSSSVSTSILPEDILPAEKEDVSSVQEDEKRPRIENEDAVQSKSINMAAVGTTEASDCSNEVPSSILSEDFPPSEKEDVLSRQIDIKSSRIENEDSVHETINDLASVEAIKASDRSDEVVIETEEPSSASSGANIGPMCC